MSETTISSISSALLEEKRRRELFPKAPRNSYENLTALASSRPGGLTLLLGGRPQLADQYQQQQQQLQQQIGNVGGLPPPRMRPAGGFGGLGLTMSSTRPPTAAGGAELSPIPPTLRRRCSNSSNRRQGANNHPPPATPAAAWAPPRRPGLPRALSSSALPPYFGGAGTSGSFGKSSVAGPVVSVADPVGANNNTAAVAGGSTTTQNGSAGTGRGGGYRPKGPPAEMEYDDEEDDESDADGRTSGKGKGRAPDEGLQLSKSVAQEKLRNGGAVANAGESAEAERRRLYEQAGVVPWAAAANNHNVVDDYVAQPPPNRSMSTAPVGFPYNLPAPAPPSTPRTTRQQMLRNEMSESLRHNLLWQRKLSRTDGGRQAEKSLVRVTLREPGTERREALPPMDPPVLEGAPKKKLVRNLSWADTSDYHRTGW
ncbi:hypothetical protein B0H13DRAFT_1965188 [Mycena leptocephala]|nr:hypothetical protein B0H13DRAFT_1965188 [Mycena leptocephala]